MVAHERIAPQPCERRSVEVSVVIASFRGRNVLEASIAALTAQCAVHLAELIVVRADTPAAIAALQREFPPVRFIAMVPGVGLPALRGAGLAAAAGRHVLLTEDNCLAEPKWIATMLARARDEVDVVGGRMDNARTTRALDWGAFFAEYGVYGAVAAEGERAQLTAANVLYARRVIPEVSRWMSDGAWENVVHDRLRASGALLVTESAARVGLNVTNAFGAFCLERFRHGNDYARGRLSEHSRTNRWLRAVMTPVLPPLLAWRIARVAGRSPARALAFARALPFTLSFLGAWAAGEAAGYIRGPLRTSA